MLFAKYGKKLWMAQIGLFIMCSAAADPEVFTNTHTSHDGSQLAGADE